MKTVNTVVIGGGMAGMAAGISSARYGMNTILLEKYPQVGKKLFATGNGRCNLMHHHPLRYYGDSDFAASVMGDSWEEKLLDFWNGIGIPVRFDRNGRGYPWSEQAGSVVDALQAALKRENVGIYAGRNVLNVSTSGDGSFLIQTEGGERFQSQRLIIATGGAAQPKLGGNQSAWPWLERLGHHFTPASPALTPLITKDIKSISGLQGIRIKCRIVIKDSRTGNELHAESGELLFSEHGISGICVMQCARFVKSWYDHVDSDETAEACIDLISDRGFSFSDIFQELIRRKESFSGEDPVALLRGFCVPRMAYAICKQAGISMRGETNLDLSNEQVRLICRTLQAYRIGELSRQGFDKAQVMMGGICCSEINPENLESRLCPGLHVAGELLDVDGDCGGYNLMFACMSGLKAGAYRRKHD